jgi:hypothetical protein
LRRYKYRIGAGILLLLLLIFHRPLLFSALNASIRAVAAKNGLIFKARLSGNPFSELELENVVLKPAHPPHPNFELLRIRSATVAYSLSSLLRQGPSQCITALSVNHTRILLRKPDVPTQPDPPSKDAVTVQATPLPHPSSPTGVPRAQSLEKALQSLFKLPLFSLESIQIEDFEIEIVQPEGDLQLHGGKLTALPRKPGVLRIESLQLPGSDAPVSLEGTTSLENHTFTVRDLRLTETLVLRECILDASERSKGRASVSLLLDSSPGVLSARLDADFKKGPWKCSLQAADFSAPALAAFCGMDGALVPEAVEGTARLEGRPQAPESWLGEFRAGWRQPFRGQKGAAVRVRSSLKNGDVGLHSIELDAPATHLSGSGSLKLPKASETWKSIEGEATLLLRCSDLSEVPAGNQTGKSAGELDGEIKVGLKRGLVQADWRVEGRRLKTEFLEASTATAEATLIFPLAERFQPDSFAGNAAISFTHPKFTSRQWSAEMAEATAAVSLNDGLLRFWNIRIQDARNALTGEFVLPLTDPRHPAELSLQLRLEDIASTRAKLMNEPLAGALSAEWNGGFKDGLFEGVALASGKDFKWGAFQLGQLRLKSKASKGKLSVEELQLAWSPQEGLQTAGTADLNPPYAYRLQGEARIPKLERLAPLFKQLGVIPNLDGAIEGSWSGEGKLEALSGTGEWKLKASRLRWDKVRVTSLECSGRYRPGLLETDRLQLATPETQLTARIEWSEKGLRIEDLALRQWNTPTLTGYLMLPLVHGAQGARWLRDGRIAGQLKAEKLDLANLFTGAGKAPSLFGSLQCSLALSGTADAPSAAFNLKGKGLRLAATPKLGASDLDLKGGYADGVLAAEGSLASPFDAPILADAKISISVPELFSSKLALGDLPIEGHLKTAGASLKPLANLWSGIRQISGRATVDAGLQGTFNNPQWRGKLSAECPVIHFSSDRAPAIGDLQAVLDFDGKQLKVQKLQADLGGGSLSIEGTASFLEMGDPTLNFSAKAREVLVVRNTQLALRLNGALALKGTWKQAVISGSAKAVKSRFQQDIEILPVAALRGGGQQERRVTGKPWFRFTSAPFSNWKFNVALATTQEDPIQVRGNRLRGTGEAELQLEGTGAEPTLHGAYRTYDMIASLPFARLEISRGRIWYTRDQPFVPQLDFSAETEVRNHRIRLYLSGPFEAPRISTSSEPPLGETELLTLLTTGALQGDSSENSQAMANRAATLLFQEFSDKVLSPSGGKERFSALRRFNLDVGAVNGRTGHQESRLTYRLNENFFMIGELGADGDFAGRIRYVLRFP